MGSSDMKYYGEPESYRATIERMDELNNIGFELRPCPTKPCRGRSTSAKGIDRSRSEVGIQLSLQQKLPYIYHDIRNKSLNSLQRPAFVETSFLCMLRTIKGLDELAAA